MHNVNINNIIQTLITHNLIKKQNTNSNNGTILYTTTSTFLEQIGLININKLPTLAPYLPKINILNKLTEKTSL